MTTVNRKSESTQTQDWQWLVAQKAYLQERVGWLEEQIDYLESHKIKPLNGHIEGLEKKFTMAKALRENLKMQITSPLFAAVYSIATATPELPPIKIPGKIANRFYNGVLTKVDTTIPTSMQLDLLSAYDAVGNYIGHVDRALRTLRKERDQYQTLVNQMSIELKEVSSELRATTQAKVLAPWLAP